MDSSDRRRTTRVTFTATATLRFEDAEYPNCATENLSTKGVFITGITGRSKGEECGVELRLAGASSDLVLRMQGRVVRCQEEGIAIQFEEVDLDSFYHLKNIVYYNTKDPDAVDREFLSGADPESVGDEFE